jgi:hypothetical protein
MIVALAVACTIGGHGAYGVPDWDGDDGELDHRIPFFLGGRTDRSNIWPEPGPIPNRKDALERLAYERVCNGHMRVRRAVRWFRRDWRSKPSSRGRR